MTVDVGAQVMASLLGLAALWYLGGKHTTMRDMAIGFALGLVSQPFWFITFIANGQYWLLPLPTAHTFVWARGLRIDGRLLLEVR